MRVADRISIGIGVAGLVVAFAAWQWPQPMEAVLPVAPGSTGDDLQSQVVAREQGDVESLRGVPEAQPWTDGAFVRLTPLHVRASSEWSQPTSSNRYPPEFAFDDDLDTAWNEGVDGAGDGEWLEAEFARPVRLGRITIVTGWNVERRGLDLFLANSHAREIAIWVDGHEVARRQVGFGERSVSMEGLGSVERTIRLVFVRVYPGSRFNDLAIPRVEMLGQEKGRDQVD